MKFHGELEALREMVAETGARGAWRVLPDRAHQFRGEDGAILNWWQSTGTLLFQGATGPAAELRRMLEGCLPGQGELFV